MAVVIGGNGLMELFLFNDLKIYEVVSFLVVTDETSRALRRSLEKRVVASVAELDYNNDAMMDLYIPRATAPDLKWIRKLARPSDPLLRSIGRGRFVDAVRGVCTAAQQCPLKETNLLQQLKNILPMQWRSKLQSELDPLALVFLKILR